MIAFAKILDRMQAGHEQPRLSVNRNYSRAFKKYMENLFYKKIFQSEYNRLKKIYALYDWSWPDLEPVNDVTQDEINAMRDGKPASQKVRRLKPETGYHPETAYYNAMVNCNTRNIMANFFTSIDIDRLLDAYEDMVMEKIPHKTWTMVYLRHRPL